jgi:hypothetical protein
MENFAATSSSASVSASATSPVVLESVVSTVASESAFSTGGRVVDPFRSRLDPETVQALICSKDWIAASDGNLFNFISTMASAACEKTRLTRI